MTEYVSDTGTKTYGPSTFIISSFHSLTHTHARAHARTHAETFVDVSKYHKHKTVPFQVEMYKKYLQKLTSFLHYNITNHLFAKSNYLVTFRNHEPLIKTSSVGQSSYFYSYAQCIYLSAQTSC